MSAWRRTFARGFKLGEMYAAGRGVAQNLTLAVEPYQRACDGGHMRGCASLGAMYEMGNGVARSTSRAGELYQRACEGGASQSCEYLRLVPTWWP